MAIQKQTTAFEDAVPAYIESQDLAEVASRVISETTGFRDLDEIRLGFYVRTDQPTTDEDGIDGRVEERADQGEFVRPVEDPLTCPPAAHPGRAIERGRRPLGDGAHDHRPRRRAPGDQTGQVGGDGGRIGSP